MLLLLPTYEVINQKTFLEPGKKAVVWVIVVCAGSAGAEVVERCLFEEHL